MRHGELKMDKIFLSIAEYCHLYGVGRTKVYELIASGDLTKAKVGTRSYITVESAAAFANRSIVGGCQDVTS